MSPPGGATDTSAAAGGHERSDPELLSELAHALRTPLGVITGYVELAQLRDDPEFRAEALAQIEAASERLRRSVDRLLSVLESDPSDVVRRFVESENAPDS
jgi:signal transduction histidine kinase